MRFNLWLTKTASRSNCTLKEFTFALLSRQRCGTPPNPCVLPQQIIFLISQRWERFGAFSLENDSREPRNPAPPPLCIFSARTPRCSLRGYAALQESTLGASA